VYNKETNTVFINIVNRHKDKAITAEIINSSGTFSGKAEASLVNIDSIRATFTFDKQKEYIPVTKEIDTEANKFSYSFPAHSFTQLKVGVKDDKARE
jgi:alpha-N-arabinofuranosidase